MDLEHINKLAKDKNGVKYLLFRQDLFDRTVDAKGMKTYDSKETVRAFLTMITKKIRLKEICIDRSTHFAVELQTFCKVEGIQIYSRMSETKVAFAERTIRSLKSIPYRYMEDYGYKYIPNLFQFLKTLN